MTFEIFQMTHEDGMETTGIRYADAARACQQAWEFANQFSNRYENSITYLVRSGNQTIYQAWWDDWIKHVIQNAQKNTPARLYLGGLGREFISV